MADVRPITPGDLDAVGAALGRAFADDPVMTYLTPKLEDAERGRRLAGFFRTEAKQRARLAGVWTGAANEGAAVWAPPDRWRTRIRDGLGLAAPILRAAGPRAIASLGVLSRMEKVHPKEPHWYLAILGTDPVHQGKGVGGALLAPVLERCDTEGLPAYLESSKESNVPYYERFGWKVTSELTLPKGGPTLYLMWRDPR
jgi:GNAT superfamily N-acetyltransferase